MGQMTVEQWYGTIKTGLTKKLTENKEALPAGFNQQRFILNCITVIQDMMKDKGVNDLYFQGRGKVTLIHRGGML